MFSVLIPSYNHQRFLVDAVLSALGSSLVTEVLVVDDGSIDRTRELFPLIQSLDRRVRLIGQHDGAINKGAPSRINELVAAANSDWVAVLNSDDLYSSSRFEMVELAVKNGTDCLFFGDLIIIDEEGNRQGIRNALRHNEIVWPDSWDMANIVKQGNWTRLLSVQNILATTTNMVFSKTLWSMVGGFRDFRYCHDWDFAIRCSIHHRMQYIPLMLSCYRIHGSNTIKEAPSGIVEEVRRMFVGVISDFPNVFNNEEIQLALAINPYAPARHGGVLESSAKGAISAPHIKDMEEPKFGELLSAMNYTYHPLDREVALTKNEFINVLLAITVRRYDAFLVSRTLERYPKVGRGHLPDLLVVRGDAQDYWHHGAVRVMRSFVINRDAIDVNELVNLQNASVDTAFSETTREYGDLDSASELSPIAVGDANDHRRTVFVLPVFLAIGGAERLALETIRQLKDKYRFVIINTDPLRPEQGSLHTEALLHAEVYDLAEITRIDERCRALRILKRWYTPSLVWICNGAPWQIENASNLREVFADIPIVDNQVYDHQEGWIREFHRPGIRAADRFIAISKRIRDVMIIQHAVPDGKIDLVYHGFNSDRMQRRELSTIDLFTGKLQLGLKPDVPLFGMVGRLTAQKRPLDLVRLAHRIHYSDVSAQFLWMGPGELESDFANLVKELGIDNITLVPPRSNVQEVMEILDGLIITSAFEGLPVAMLEALSLGVPVLSTDVGAVGEVLERYGSGMLCEGIGDIDALETAFRRFIGSLSSFKDRALGSAATIAREFSSARMAKEYDLSFTRAVGEFGR